MYTHKSWGGRGGKRKRKTLGLSYCLLSLSPAIQKLLCRVVVHTVLQKSSLRVFHVKWCAIPPRISLESKRLRYQKVGIKGSMTTTSSAMQHLPRSSSNSFSLTALSISSHTELVCVMFSAESFIFFFRSDGTQSGELLFLCCWLRAPPLWLGSIVLMWWEPGSSSSSSIVSSAWRRGQNSGEPKAGQREAL